MVSAKPVINVRSMGRVALAEPGVVRWSNARQNQKGVAGARGAESLASGQASSMLARAAPVCNCHLSAGLACPGRSPIPIDGAGQSGRPAIRYDLVGFMPSDLTSRQLPLTLPCEIFHKHADIRQARAHHEPARAAF